MTEHKKKRETKRGGNKRETAGAEGIYDREREAGMVQCVCVCVCVTERVRARASERARESARARERERERGKCSERRAGRESRQEQEGHGVLRRGGREQALGKERPNERLERSTKTKTKVIPQTLPFP